MEFSPPPFTIGGFMYFFKILIFFLIISTFSLSSGQWKEVLQSVPALAVDCAAYDELQYAYAINYSGPDENYRPIEGVAVIVTEDRGQSWDTVYSNITSWHERWERNLLKGMQYLGKDSLVFFITKEEGEGVFFRTHDHGKSWDTTHINIVNNMNKVFYMKFKDDKNGVVCAYRDSILYTDDGGASWKLFKNLPDIGGYGFSSLDISNKKIMISVNRRPSGKPDFKLYKKILISNNWGKKWKVIHDDNDTTAWKTKIFKFRNENEIWGAGFLSEDDKRTIIKRTTNDGMTWDTLVYGGDLGIPHNIYFYDDNKVILHSRKGFYRSEDGGESWKKDDMDNLFRPETSSIPSWDTGIAASMAVINIYDKGSSINRKQQLSDIKLYPNPIARSESLNIFLTDKNQIASGVNIKIIDMSGKTVDSYSPGGAGTIQYDFDRDIAPGIYFVILERNGEILGKGKLIVE